MQKIKLDTIEEAIEEIRKGNFIIVVDDEDRENEGDFIIAAECVTPEKINFSVIIVRAFSSTSHFTGATSTHTLSPSR